MEVAIRAVLDLYPLEGNFIKSTPVGSGHIHDTLHVETSRSETGYLLQRINTTVFKDIEALAGNTKLLAKQAEARQVSIPRLINTIDGQPLAQCDGSFWRCYVFCKGTKSHDIVPNNQMLESGGKAFGEFIASLNGVKGFKEVIPGFHDMTLRLSQLDTAIANCKDQKRLDKSGELIELANNHVASLSTLRELIYSQEIPLRIVHNDTKINNLLYDSSGSAQFVVDLDTVMPGYVHYDYGDALRTTAIDVSEDETDLSRMIISEARVNAFSSGFMGVLNNVLTEQEIKTLHEAPNYMSFIMGIRFLADYLSGDIYYKVHHPMQNYNRARNQLNLAVRWADYATRLSQLIQGLR